MSVHVFPQCVCTAHVFSPTVCARAHVHAFPTKKAQQVRRPKDLGHGRVGVVSQDLSILGPFKLVEQLSAQHDVEVLSDSRYYFIHCILPKLGGERERVSHS